MCWGSLLVQVQNSAVSHTGKLACKKIDSSHFIWHKLKVHLRTKIRQFQTRNVSMGHGCPRYCQIHMNRALSLTKGHNSYNNRWILSVIEHDLYFMITYLCMQYESNTPTYSKDIARKPFFIR